MKKISFLIVTLLLFYSCKTQEFIGLYYYNKDINLETTNLNGVQQTLELIDKKRFKYSIIEEYRDGPKNQSIFITISEQKGFGYYKVIKDSIYLTFDNKSHENEVENTFELNKKIVLPIFKYEDSIKIGTMKIVL